MYILEQASAAARSFKSSKGQVNIEVKLAQLVRLALSSNCHLLIAQTE